MSRKIETEDLTIVVSRYWPLHKLKAVDIRRSDGNIVHNSITLTAEQVKTLHTALTEVLYPEQLPKDKGEE